MAAVSSPISARYRFGRFGCADAARGFAADFALDAHLAAHQFDEAAAEIMHRDGSFDALFDKHFARTLATLRLPERTVIELEIRTCRPGCLCSARNCGSILAAARPGAGGMNGAAHSAANDVGQQLASPHSGANFMN